MSTTHLGRAVACTVIASLAIVLAAATRPIVGQEKAAVKGAVAGPAAQVPAKDSPAKGTTAAKKVRRRLPNYYRTVVDDEQRRKVYAIQKEYGPKIQALRAQLAALIKDRDEKIATVLTPEQRKKVEELKAAAEAKRNESGKPKPPAKAKPKETEPAK